MADRTHRLALLASMIVGLPLVQSCQVEGLEPVEKASNGPIAFTGQIENATHPACACAGDPTYNQGISLVTAEPNRSETVGEYPGIFQDSADGLVFLHNGELILYETDAEITSRGFNWAFERRYRSGIDFNGPLGHNWGFNYNRRLYVRPDGNVLRMDGYARADQYTLAPDGNYRAPAGYYTQLIKNRDGTFTERDRSGTVVAYDQPDAYGVARMTRLADRNGNTMRFVYDGNGQLVRVIDTLGRPITYHYSLAGRLVEVKDFSGRQLKFAYDRNGDLVAVTSPSVTGTPNGNDFPDGKTTRYGYSSGFTDSRLNHNLVAIVAPNEVASNGVPRVRVEYQTDAASPHVDRIRQLTLGGVNASDVSAGGTISYAYEQLGSADPADPTSTVSQTTVIDRNGNRTEYEFNRLGTIVQIREFTNRDVRQDDPEFFETRYSYNKDGELFRQINPHGNAIDYRYDENNPTRFGQGNLLAETRLPDPQRGGDQEVIKTSYTYEPIYNQLRSTTGSRGNSPTYLPQNGGANSPQRYATMYVFDYQEGQNFGELAAELGVTEDQIKALLQESGIPMALGDINGDGRTDQFAGNPIKVERPTVHLLPDSNMASIEGSSHQPIAATYAYNDVGQLLRRVDPEGNTDIYHYYSENDPDGDGKDVTSGVADRPFGYLREMIRDAESSPNRDSGTNPEPARIRMQYFYDRVGNVNKEVDGRGIATEYIHNELDQIVQIVRAADVTQALRNREEPDWAGCVEEELVECRAGMVAFQYLTNIFYDFNDNIVRRQVENRDSNNQDLPGSFIEFADSYDILDNQIQETREVSESPREVITTRYRYDRNENRVLEISPVAVAGTQPSNVIASTYDERDLLFTSTRGGLTDQFRRIEAHAGIPERNRIPTGPDVSTVTHVYDLNRNERQTVDATDNTGDGQPEVTTRLYDGFDRLVSIVDGIGNQSFTEYDPASNPVRVSNFGPVGGVSPRHNDAATFAQPLAVGSFRQPLLSQFESKYDELSRKFEDIDLLFAYREYGVPYARRPILKDGPLGASNDGRVVTVYEHDRNSRQTFLIEDDGDTFQTLYDGADRMIEQIDPEQNRVQYTYDDNDNLVRMVEVEVTQPRDVRAGRVPDLREMFVRTNAYDALNRRIRTTDNVGQTMRYHYDSRGNSILMSDAQHSPEPKDLIADPLGLLRAYGGDGPSVTRLNRPGNTVEYFYDGANRKISEVHRLRVNGHGRNAIDNKANPANPDGLIVIDYAWDANDRLVAQADDGSTPGDQNMSIGIIEPTDPQGNVTRYAYDDLDRQTREVFDDGSINDFTYDADDNRVRVIDENGSIIRNTYDGANRLVHREIERATSRTPHPVGGYKDPSLTWQVIGTTLHEFEYDGLSRLTRSFDNNEPDDGGDDATVTYAYDSLSRLLEEVQNGHAVSSRWEGDSNRVGLVYPNGRELKITVDELDRVDRITDGSQLIADYDYIGPERLLERSSGNGVRLTYLDDARHKAVGYDGLKRRVLHRHLAWDGSLVAGFAYDYDRANNRQREVRLHDEDRAETYDYDSRHRLVRFAREGQPEDTWQLDGVGNWVSHRGVANEANNLNEYTAIGGARRLYDDNGNLIDDGTNRYIYDVGNRLRRVIRKADGAVIAVYSYDGHNRRFQRVVTNTSAYDDRVRYLYDLWRLIEERRSDLTQQYVYGRWIDERLTLDKDRDRDGAVDQTYFYHRDGKTHVVALTDDTARVADRVTYDAYGQPSSDESPVGNPYLFTGRRYDPETGWYYHRYRHYDPGSGRFPNRDWLGIWTDRDSLGNGYAYAWNNPATHTDPWGLAVNLDWPSPEGGGGGGGGGGKPPPDQPDDPCRPELAFGLNDGESLPLVGQYSHLYLFYGLDNELTASSLLFREKDCKGKHCEDDPIAALVHAHARLNVECSKGCTIDAAGPGPWSDQNKHPKYNYRAKAEIFFAVGTPTTDQMWAEADSEASTSNQHSKIPSTRFEWKCVGAKSRLHLEASPCGLNQLMSGNLVATPRPVQPSALGATLGSSFLAPSLAPGR